LFPAEYQYLFQPADIIVSLGYDYSVFLTDEAGQASGSLGCSSAPNVFPLSYDKNDDSGMTSGSVPPMISRPENFEIDVEDPTKPPYNLARTDYVFSGWNTKPDGSGVAYVPGLHGDPLVAFTFPRGATTLYAQWYTTGINLSFDLSTYGIVFQAGGSSLPGNGLSVVGGTQISVSCASAELRQGGTGWDWYLDGDIGTPIGSSSALTYTTPDVPGQHIVSCTVTYHGIMYSGYFLLAITD
jgi:hypothetical protein